MRAVLARSPRPNLGPKYSARGRSALLPAALCCFFNNCFLRPASTDVPVSLPRVLLGILFHVSCRAASMASLADGARHTLPAMEYTTVAIGRILWLSLMWLLVASRPHLVGGLRLGVQRAI